MFQVSFTFREGLEKGRCGREGMEGKKKQKMWLQIHASNVC